LSPRILQAPKTYVVSLAMNLLNAGADGSGHETLQTIATTLAEALRKAPVTDQGDDTYAILASLVRYNNLEVKLDSQRYKAEMAQLVEDDDARSKVDFTLTDTEGRSWNLKALRGSVVLVNVWQSLCDRCRGEIPAFEELYKQFHERGLVILTLIGDPGREKPFGFHLLDDPRGQVAQQLRVQTFPRSFVFDREGRLVAQTDNLPSRSGWLEKLNRAGL
jgi:peroxiredoxin